MARSNANLHLSQYSYSDGRQYVKNVVPNSFQITKLHAVCRLLDMSSPNKIFNVALLFLIMFLQLSPPSLLLSDSRNCLAPDLDVDVYVYINAYIYTHVHRINTHMYM